MVDKKVQRLLDEGLLVTRDIAFEELGIRYDEKVAQILHGTFRIQFDNTIYYRAEMVDQMLKERNGGILVLRGPNQTARTCACSQSKFSCHRSNRRQLFLSTIGVNERFSALDAYHLISTRQPTSCLSNKICFEVFWGKSIQDKTIRQDDGAFRVSTIDESIREANENRLLTAKEKRAKFATSNTPQDYF